MLAAMKFPTLFIEWIRGCITSSRFFISINGGLVGFFKGAKGVRQGDMLSLYLFFLDMNVLSKLLDIATDHGVLVFI